jgi:tripartite-type tricarboxylate transporter receptor subunit TctC
MAHKMFFRSLYKWLAVAFAFLGTVNIACLAQTYPAKPVKLVVPFPAGGATDIFARALSQKLVQTLNTPVFIDNRPGAGGTLGSDLVAKSSADGYTLLLGTSSTHTIAPLFNPHLPYDAVRDFTPIVHVGNAPNIMLVPNTSPARSVKEWIAYAKANPGKLNYGSSGNGTIIQLTSELFKAQANVFVVHIPYKGTALAIPDLVSGKLDVMFDALPSGLPHVKDGQLRALGVSSLKRSPLAPDLPAIAETVPGYESVTWFGLYGPKGLPADIVRKVNAAVNQTLKDADIKDKLFRLGIEPVGGSSAEFSELLARESNKWRDIIVSRQLNAD